MRGGAHNEGPRARPLQNIHGSCTVGTRRKVPDMLRLLRIGILYSGSFQRPVTCSFEQAALHLHSCSSCSFVNKHTDPAVLPIRQPYHPIAIIILITHLTQHYSQWRLKFPRRAHATTAAKQPQSTAKVAQTLTPTTVTAKSRTIATMSARSMTWPLTLLLARLSR
jgi:hypothetical protein